VVGMYVEGVLWGLHVCMEDCGGFIQPGSRLRS
jgi:hypothetical protein